MIIRLFEREPRELDGHDLFIEMANKGVTEAHITRAFAALLLYEQIAERPPDWINTPTGELEEMSRPEKLHNASLYGILIKVEGVKE